MGFKTWLGKNVGTAGFGHSYAPASVENGLGLGRVLFIGHSIASSGTSASIFESEDEIHKANHFAPALKISLSPLTASSGSLYVNSCAAGIAIAIQLAITASSVYFSEENSISFQRSLGAATRLALISKAPTIPIDLIFSFLNLPKPPEVNQVINLKKPGSGDLFQIYVQRLAQLESKGIGFLRGGEFGFGQPLVELAADTVTGIQKAAAQFGW